MATVHYSTAAAQDIEDIVAWTRRRWGERQCEIYLSAIEQTCESLLCETPEVAQQVPGWPQLHRWHCWHHMIYFQLVTGGIEIVRVLHEKMLPDNHL